MIATIPNVTVALDETEDYSRLVVTMPKGMTLPVAFVRQCHHTAGEHGASIEWVRI